VTDPAGLTVFVRGLRIQAEVGLYPHERGRAQPLVVDLELQLAPGPVVHLRDTVDYDRVVRAAKAIAAEGHVELVETYAARLLAACLAEPRVTRARVRVEKPGAVPDADAAGVEVTGTAGLGEL
jgi:dihydroneopterin aldolase